MLDRVKELYEDLGRRRVMLSFTGMLTPDLVTALLEAIEQRIARIEPDVKARKRVFNVVVECLQNLYHHTTVQEPGGRNGHSVPQGVVVIAATEDGYSVLTGNFMSAQEVTQLKDHLDHINSLDPSALREFYKQQLAEGVFSAKGGGGLGMIDIARKSGGKLEYGFVHHDEDSTFFSLNVNVNP